MTEVLIACASRPNGVSLAVLSKELELPKTSLHRMLRTLEQGDYLVETAGRYLPGPASYHMANLIVQSKPATGFPGCARPAVEWLARETSESVMLGVLSDDRLATIFIEAVDSTEPLRFTVPIGDRRGLHYGSTGKTVLAFMPEKEIEDYIASHDDAPLTPFSTRKADLPKVLARARQTGVVFDRNGSFEGASAMSSPVFDPSGAVFSAIALAGPTERMDANQARFQELVKTAGKRISRAVGYMGDYPPAA